MSIRRNRCEEGSVPDQLARTRRPITIGRQRRLLIAVLLGLGGLLVMTAMGVGDIRAGSPWVAWRGLVELGGSRFEMTGSDAADGARPGDILALADLDRAGRLDFRFVAAGRTFPCIVERAGLRPTLNCPFFPAPPMQPAGGLVDLVLRLLLLGSGLLVIVRGHGRASLAAGLYLASDSIADSLLTNFAGLPPWMQIVGILTTRTARLCSYLALYWFGMRLLAAVSERSRRMQHLVFGACFACAAIVQLNAPTDLLLGHWLLPLPLDLFCPPHILVGLCLLFVFSRAARAARGEAGLAIRVIFWSTVASVGGFGVQEIYLLFRELPPTWLFPLFAFARVGVAIGFPWAILQRRLVVVDFIVSRAAVAVVSVAIVVILINLFETMLESAVAGYESNLVGRFGVPIALAFCFRPIEQMVERLLDRTLYRDRLHAADAVHDMIEQMPSATDLDSLLLTVTTRTAQVMHARRVGVYSREEAGYLLRSQAGSGDLPATIGLDDPGLARVAARRVPEEMSGQSAALPAGTGFPMVVFGRPLGVLFCERRLHDEHFDPVETALLAGLAHELATAFAWLRAPEADAPQLRLGAGTG